MQVACLHTHEVIYLAPVSSYPSSAVVFLPTRAGLIFTMAR